MTITDEDRKSMLVWARQCIEEHLTGRKPHRPDFSAYPSCGAFVTLHKNGQLRGCIGYTVSSDPLDETLKEAALAAAFQDPRFPPLKQDELEAIDLEISLLTPPEPVGSPEDLEMGTHGGIIRSGYNSGLFLPQVATEQGWGTQEFMDHLCRKAGLPPTYWKTDKYELYRFTAVILSEKDNL